MANDNEIMRFVTQRSAQFAPGPLLDHLLIPLQAPRALGADGERRAAREGARPLRAGTRAQRESARRSARAFRESRDFVRSLSSGQVPIAALNAELLDHGDEVEPQELAKRIRDLSGTTPEKLVESEGYRTERAAAGESLVAALLTLNDPAPEPDLAGQGAGALAAPATPAQNAQDLLRRVRLFALIDRIAAKSPALASAADVRDFLLDSIIVLPATFPRPESNLARTPSIADLQVVRMGAARYEPGEIAHIENALRGELRERSHRRLESTELTILTESEVTQVSEQELQSTERFELQTEAEKELSQGLDAEAGLTVDAVYGPVRLGVHAEVAAHTAQRESARTASSFARETTQRAAMRVQTRAQETRTSRSRRDVEEINKHVIDNSDGDAHVIGVYRWIDKVYKAQVFTYGKRLMLEFIVPEPAAFLRHATTAGGGDAAGPPPAPPTRPGGDQPLAPADITDANFDELVAAYGAEGVEPPPPARRVVTVAFDQPAKPEDGGPPPYFFKTNDVMTVPEGYRASQWHWVVFTSGDPKLPGQVPVKASVGRYVAERLIGDGESDTWSGSQNMNGEVGKLPVSLAIGVARGYTMSVTVECDRSEQGLDKWRLQTYEAIMRAYRARRSEYEDRVAAAAIGGGVGIVGTNPIENRLTERRELKRGSIELLLGSHFDAAPLNDDAVIDHPDRGPLMDYAVIRRERDTIQFFEQAFEWARMTYAFYPYFWGRERNWREDSLRRDADALFGAFLSAGAARVAIPVRPGFESAVSLYLGTGIIWNGGNVPQASDPLYVSVVTEINEQQAAESGGTPVGEEWEVRLPTTLVMLQPNAQLNPGP